MSYDEVEKGLPSSLDKVIWSNPRRQPVSVIRPTWALITPSSDPPSDSDSMTRTRTVSPSLRTPSVPAIHRPLISPVPKRRTCQVSPSTEGEAPLFKKRPPPPPPTNRYIMQDSDNSIKLIKVEDSTPLPSTLTIGRPKLLRQARSTSIPVPKIELTLAQSTTSSSTGSEVMLKRARHFVIFLLTLLPPLLFTVGIQYVKWKLSLYPISIQGLCIFQGILWPSVIFLTFNKFWINLRIFQGIQNGWKELLALILLGPSALILLLASLSSLNVISLLTLTFPPLVIATFIKNISHEKSFSVELCVTTVLTYAGMTLIGMSVLTLTSKPDQDRFVYGFTAAVASIMLTIPSCLLLQRLRRRNVDDSITVSGFALGGTAISITILVLDLLRIRSDLDLDAGKISAIITFIFFGILFQFIESKINQAKADGDGGRKKSVTPNFLRLSKTRVGVFLLSGIWEVGQGLWLSSARTIDYASTLSILGIFLTLSSYCLTIVYEAWLRSAKAASQNGSEIRLNRCACLSWLCSRSRNSQCK